MQRILIVLILFAATPVLQAQEPLGGCFRGRPRPACRSFWLVEAGVRHRLAPATTYRGDKIMVGIGWMGNRTDRTALGATAFLITNLDDESRIGVMARARRWLSPSVGIDIGAGPSFALSRDTVAASGVGFVGEVGASLDWVGFYTQVELVPKWQRYESSAVQWHVGVRGGSYVGALGIAATLVGLAVKGWKDAW